MKIVEEKNILRKYAIFNSLIEYKDTRYPDVIFYHKNNIIYFELDTKSNNLWCHYDKVWRIFSNEYTLEYNETQCVIKNEAGIHTNWGEVTPLWQSNYGCQRWEYIPIGGSNTYEIYY